MSEWKEDANKRRNVRQSKAGPETTGPARKRKTPSPKKRPREVPIWEVHNEWRYMGDARYTVVSAEKANEALHKAKELGFPAYEVSPLHQKKRANYSDILDTGKAIDWDEHAERWWKEPPSLPSEQQEDNQQVREQHQDL